MLWEWFYKKLDKNDFLKIAFYNFGKIQKSLKSIFSEINIFQNQYFPKSMLSLTFCHLQWAADPAGHTPA